jgi:YHS domain-containing protein
MACLALLAANIAHSQSPGATSAPLAMKGYDPVAYFTDGKATPGSSAFSHIWDGVRYQFASAAHRDLFAADPARYAPQFSGSCTASMANGLRIEGNPETWVIADGRLFLFAGPQGLDMARANPNLLASAGRNWQMLGAATAK